MKPQPAISVRVISEKRAAAARVNGAKSRGPVTAQGRANSSRNSFRHGLRSQTLFTDTASRADLDAQLAAFERDFAPRSAVERNLVRMMAVAYWRQTCVRKLETSMLNREIRRLQSLSSNEKAPEGDPVMLLARAFRSLSDHTCFSRISRLESRFELQYLSAFSTLTEHRRWRTECAANRIPKNVNCNERTRHVAENTLRLSVSDPLSSVFVVQTVSGVL